MKLIKYAFEHNQFTYKFYYSSKGFNSSQRSDVKLRSFLNNLSHFNINNLSELISIKQNYFNVDDYLDVCIACRCCIIVFFLMLPHLT